MVVSGMTFKSTNVVVVICMVIICILLSPIVLILCLCSTSYHGKAEAPVTLKSNLVDFPNNGHQFPLTREVKSNWQRSHLLPCIAFLKTYPDENNVALYGVSYKIASLLSMLFPKHTFTIVGDPTNKSIKLPYNIADITVVSATDIKPDSTLLYCTGKDMEAMIKLHQLVKPIAGAYEYHPKCESFIKYDSIYIPIWGGNNNLESWVFCKSDAPITKYNVEEYKGQMFTYKKQVTTEHYQQREDELIDKKIQQYITDFLGTMQR
jgi:hypothetical protein